MQDTKSFSYQLNNSQALDYSSAESSLITLGRVQKLDLLIHLITNLRQSLVICGLEGIGKTTLLNELIKRKKDTWLISNITTSSSLSFEAIQDQLYRFVVQAHPEYKNQDLPSILSGLDKQNQKIVMVLDDAGALVPGLINTLIQYAEASICLRIVFALTHDDLHEKNSSDRAIENCHLIEIPPLTEIQCSAFLQNLAAKPDASISLNAINDSVVEKIYKETQGIPGKMVSALPAFSNYAAVRGLNWWGLFVPVVFLSVAVLYIYSDEALEQEAEQIDTAITLPKPEVVQISSPVVSSAGQEKTYEIKGVKKFADSNKAEAVSEHLVVDAKIKASNEELEVMDLAKDKSLEDSVIKSDIDNLKIKTVSDISKKPIIPVSNSVVERTEIKIEDSAVVKEMPKAESQAIEPKVEKKVEKKTDGIEWLHQQSQKKYTIQLMALSTHKAVAIFVEKNKQLKENLKFVRMTKQGKEKFVLIYGVYDNKDMAIKDMKLLPAKYRKSWVRRFRDLQRATK